MVSNGTSTQRTKKRHEIKLGALAAAVRPRTPNGLRRAPAVREHALDVGAVHALHPLVERGPGRADVAGRAAATGCALPTRP